MEFVLTCVKSITKFFTLLLLTYTVHIFSITQSNTLTHYNNIRNTPNNAHGIPINNVFTIEVLPDDDEDDGFLQFGLLRDAYGYTDSLKVWSS